MIDFKKFLTANPESDEGKTVFVFSTDVVMNSWIDFCVKNPEISGVSAVPLERFTAWDKFKGEFVASSEKGKTSIPSLMRKIFIRTLIQENAAKPFFKKLINPEFRDSAVSFTNWISKILPSLEFWHKKIEEKNGGNLENAALDEEDSDYLELYNRYSAFLNENSFFEPAWIKPDFSGSGKKFILIYPELLEDYSDYVDIFESCSDITTVNFGDKRDQEICWKDENQNSPEALKYSDARKELRRTILFIRKLVNEKKAEYEEITLSVPDLETYRPYLERELTQYCVPYVIRAGNPLTKNCAGQIFTEIQNCYSSDFDFDSIRALLLDEYIPWKKEFSELRTNFIKEGNKLRCLCNYDKVDIWEEAFKKVSEDEREYNFYKSLKNDINAICRSCSFEAILEAWIIFKNRFLEESNFTNEANNIISRCVTQIKELIQLEKDFCKPKNLVIDNPFEFFMSEINGKTYTPQNKKCGLSVFPYKLSAAANYKYQFVINASQSNLEIQYKKLSFLSGAKRKALNLEADDKKFNPSKIFIKLYAKNKEENFPTFSYCEDSFSGFAICHNALNLKKEENPFSELDQQDFILNEKKLLQTGKATALSKAQKKQFKRWFKSNTYETEDAYYSVSKNIQKLIDKVLISNREKKLKQPFNDGKYLLTQTDLKNFYPCHRYWLLNNVLTIKAQSLETDLMQTFDMGNINHKILELFMKDYLESGKPLPVCDEDNSFENEEEIYQKVLEYTDKAIHSPDFDFAKSPLTVAMLESQKEKLADTIMDFLKEFLKKNCLKPGKVTKTAGFGGCLVRGVEKPYSSKFENKNYNLYGKIDCLLTSSIENPDDNGWVIIDYKNTEASIPETKEIIKKDDETIIDFQMPVYITLLQNNETADEIDVASFYSIKKPYKKGRGVTAIDKNTKDKTLEDFSSTLNEFDLYAQDFAATVKEGNFIPDNVDVFETCSKCSFNSICRLNYNIGKRNCQKQESTKI